MKNKVEIKINDFDSDLAVNNRLEFIFPKKEKVGGFSHNPVYITTNLEHDGCYKPGPFHAAEFYDGYF